MTKTRWRALTSAMGLPLSTECFESLCAAYSEPHRFYHTASHIDALLEHLDSAIHLSERPLEVELAIWFHDAVYQPCSTTNEAESANWAQAFLHSAHYPNDGIDRIYQLVMATSHAGDANNIDQQLVVDIDLAILGAEAEVYDEYERNIRKEYYFVPSVIYRKHRTALLESFLSKDNIYYLDYFKTRYQQAARANIQRAIELL